MADIAMLVAEEYERRVKNSKERGEEIELLSCVGVFIEKFNGSYSSSSMREKMVEILEPKSQITLAATNGLFSA
ncbi:hypothetical protein AAHA92_03423 [Salvia divinorum]|uniref:Uncharacterized protein n=1 Tax=Salvia divinorum TaxID=28513 RepID=A0ABD1IH26_SALDI